MPQYSNDPRWLRLRRRDVCAKCHAEMKPGEMGFYYPIGKRMLCDGPNCGKAASREFDAAAFDESVYRGGYGGKARRPRGLVGLLSTRPEVPRDPHWLHDVIRAEFTWHGKPMVAVKHKGGAAELYVVNNGLEMFAGYCSPKVTQGLCGAVNNYLKKKALGYREDDFRKRPGFKVISYQGPGLPMSASPSGKRRHARPSKPRRRSRVSALTAAVERLIH